MNCGIARQIAVNADEPEAQECPECKSSMTQNLTGDYFTCDSEECANEVNLDGSDVYE